jgi:hypothetical protein
MAPYMLGASVQKVFASGSNAVTTAVAQLPWTPTANAMAVSGRINDNLALRVAPAIDEESFDAISALTLVHEPTVTAGRSVGPQRFGVSPMVADSTATFEITKTRAGYLTFEGVVNPVDKGTAEVRRLHLDAMTRLREFNAFVVAQSDNTPSVEALIVAARLSLIRDYGLTALQTEYGTVSEALLDLDFVTAVYDDEEAVAAHACYDVLVTAIRQARADVLRAILSKNIRLPGVVQSEIYGLWPSVVAAHKLFADGRRYLELESYNHSMSPFYLGRDIVAPADQLHG